MGATLNSTGHVAGRRGRRMRRPPMSEINVTPFVDVMLVLLIIFMVTAPLLTVGVPLELPQAKGKQIETNKEPIIVSVTRSGEVFLGQEEKTPMRLEEIGSKLNAVAGNRGGADEPIFVRGDKSVEYGLVAKVMGRIKEAGFKKISLITEVESGG